LAIVAIIPARFASTRLPGKPLSDILGKPLIQHVHERVCRARRIERVLVATDDERIATAVHRFGGESIMTARHHPTGTDRVSEVVERLPSVELVVNVQGDEPLLDPADLDAVVDAMLADRELPMATLALPLRDADEMLSPSVVKVVTDTGGNALYFSRSPIPFVRAGEGDLRSAARAAVERGIARKHVGLYAYRRDALLRLAALPPSTLEQAEELEQLRALQNGMRLRVVPAGGEGGMAVDTPQDLERVREILATEIAG
jgi:3-deoxy-manno-octulosonate cytidylyltransferase (CMP-KDO synthetase)